MIAKKELPANEVRCCDTRIKHRNREKVVAIEKRSVDLRPPAISRSPLPPHRGCGCAYFPVSRLQPISHLYLNLNLLSFDPSPDPPLPAAHSTRFNLRKPTKWHGFARASHGAAMRPMLFQVIERRGSRVALLRYSISPKGKELHGCAAPYMHGCTALLLLCWGAVGSNLPKWLHVCCLLLPCRLASPLLHHLSLAVFKTA